MNDFTKEELEIMAKILDGSKHVELWSKISSMIAFCSPFDVRRIAQSHLREAHSLISHAMVLMGMENE